MSTPSRELFGTLVSDEALMIVDVSRTFCEDFACSREQLIDREVSEIVSARDRQALRSIDRALSASSSRGVDMIALIEVGEVSRLSRLLMRPDGLRWTLYVECIDTHDNLVFSLYSGYRRWSAALKGSADGVVFVDKNLVITDYNAQFVEHMSFRSEYGVLLGEEALTGAELPALIRDEAFAPLQELQDEMWASGGYRGELRLQGRWFDLEVIPHFLPGSGLVGFSASFRDISDRHRIAIEQETRRNEQLAHREAIIRAQKESIRALSAPRIPLSPTVTVVPLIGALDSERVDELTGELLVGAAKDQTDTMLLDLTGITEIDSGAATSLLRAIRALRLVGARAVLTGIGPRVAQTLTETDLSADDVTIYASLQDAIRTLLGTAR